MNFPPLLSQFLEPPFHLLAPALIFLNFHTQDDIFRFKLISRRAGTGGRYSYPPGIIPAVWHATHIPDPDTACGKTAVGS